MHFFVARSEELSEGQRKILSCGGVEVGIFRIKGMLHAFRNICPHQGGPVAEGPIIHRVQEDLREDKTCRGMSFDRSALQLVCPWHGWSFDIVTGLSAGDGGSKLSRVDVWEKGGEIQVAI